MGSSTRRHVAAAAGACTAGAGVLHAAVAAGHRGEGSLPLLFALAAVAQLVVALSVAAGVGPRALVATVLVNAGAAAVWVAAHLTGVPFVDGLSEPEAVVRQDLVVLLLEVAAGGAALLGARRPRPERSSLWSPAWVLVTVPVLIGFSAPHEHREHADLAAPADQATAHHGAEEARAPAADPIFRGADTSRASAAQLEAARRLIVETRGATRHLIDEASVVRAGYRSIGDGGAVGSFEHFVNAVYLADGRELDPERIESVVLERTPSGKRVVSAMYILTPGKNLADAPDTAGQTTRWHDHKDLCWDPTGVRLAGRLVNGRCHPGGTFVPTPPMLHVWLQDHPCGPFAGIDGHGTACTGSHGH